MTMPHRPQALYRLTRVAPPRDHRGALATLATLLDRVVARIAALPAGGRRR
jgi:hypothetical protein